MTGTSVLYISDSIGLGHATRDLAIARELRALNPEVEIMWLAGDPAKKLIAESPRTVPGEPPSSSMISWSRKRRHGRGLGTRNLGEWIPPGILPLRGEVRTRRTLLC